MKLDKAKQILSENNYICEDINVRQATNKILDMCDEGLLTWPDVAKEALNYMSEDEVADMARDCGWFDDDDDDEY